MALRITVEEQPDRMALKLEGRLAGAWVAELDRLWAETSEAREGRKLTLDLRETTYADRKGISTLRAIYQETGAEFLTASPWTEHLAEEVRSEDEKRDER